MHLIESFSLVAGKKIDKIDILEKFYPIPTENYIVVQPYSKPSKNYDYYQLVIDIIKPILEKAGISILQIGGKDEKPLGGCEHYQGMTSINQTASIIKNAKLIFGADSFGLHLGGHYNIPVVGLYSNNYVDCVKPYFGDSTKHILLEPEREAGNKPSFSYEENPKTINTIKPEKIARSICQLLNLNFEFPFQTVFIGPYYNAPKMIEMCPGTAINLSNLGMNSIIVRMDYQFDEQVLLNQMAVSSVAILTNRPINIDLLKNNKSRIHQLIYKIEENDHPEFAKQAAKLGLNMVLISSLTNEQLNPKKFSYLDVGMIHRKDLPRSIKETPFPNLNPDNLFYRSNKITLSKQKIFTSRASLIKDISVININPAIQSIIDDPYFYEDLDYFWVLERI